MAPGVLKLFATLFGDVTITGERLQNLTYALHALMAIEQ